MHLYTFAKIALERRKQKYKRNECRVFYWLKNYEFGRIHTQTTSEYQVATVFTKLKANGNAIQKYVENYIGLAHHHVPKTKREKKYIQLRALHIITSVANTSKMLNFKQQYRNIDCICFGINFFFA